MILLVPLLAIVSGIFYAFQVLPLSLLAVSYLAWRAWQMKKAGKSKGDIALAVFVQGIALFIIMAILGMLVGPRLNFC